MLRESAWSDGAARRTTVEFEEERMRRRGAVRIVITGCALVATVCALVVAGCARDSAPERQADVPGSGPATPAPAQPTAQPPAGTVLPFRAPIALLAVVPDSAVVAAVVGADRSTLALLRQADPAAPPRAVPLGAPAAGLSPGRGGEILVPTAHRVLRVDAATAAVTSVPVDGEATSAVIAADGRLAVATTDGTVRIFGADGKQKQAVSGLTRVDALAWTAEALVAVDRGNATITELDLDAGKPGLALQAGAGPGGIASDHYGRILIADTRGKSLLVLSADPLLLRQRFPVGFSPYAVAYDRRTDTTWVTSTASNEVVGFDLSTGIPKEVRRHPTVRQPNSLAVDDRTGELFVGSAADGGVQRIGGR